MRRASIVLVLIALVAGSIAAPASAAKKKKKKKPPAVTYTPVELKYFTHWDSDGATPEGCSGPTHMNLQDSPGDTTCSTTTQVAQEVLAATGQELISYNYPATEGVPFILDASRKLTGEVTLRGTFTIEAYAQLVLTGTVNGQEVTIAEGETESGNGALSNTAQGVNLPGPPAVVAFEIDIDPALDKQTVTAMSLELTVRGVHRGHIDHERTPTYLVIPAFTAG